MLPFTVSTHTDSFRRPELSEDRSAVHFVAGGLVVVVADGAGGAAGGGPAADLVLRVVAEAIARPGFNPFSPAAWTELLIAADGLVVRDRVAGETTCVVVAVGGDGRIVGASVGDSCAVVVGDGGRLDELTEGQHRKRRLGGGRAAPVLFERRVYLHDVLACSCGGRRSIVADIHEPDAIRAILESLGLLHDVPHLARARDPTYDDA